MAAETLRAPSMDPEKKLDGERKQDHRREENGLPAGHPVGPIAEDPASRKGDLHALDLRAGRKISQRVADQMVPPGLLMDDGYRRCEGEGARKAETRDLEGWLLWPGGSAAGDGVGKRCRNRPEHGRKAVAHGGQGADRGDRDQSSDQAILDSRRTTVFLHETRNEREHVGLRFCTAVPKDLCGIGLKDL